MKSQEYQKLINQINAKGSQKFQGYSNDLLLDIPVSEREEAEQLIWNTYYEKKDVSILVLFPFLLKYDGIRALEDIIKDCKIPSDASMSISLILYERTEDNKYLQIAEKNIIEAGYNYSFIASATRLKPDKQVYDMFVKIYKACKEETALSTCIRGLLYNAGFLRDIHDFTQISQEKELINIMKNAPISGRDLMIQKLENGEFDKYNIFKS